MGIVNAPTITNSLKKCKFEIFTEWGGPVKDHPAFLLSEFVLVKIYFIGGVQMKGRESILEELSQRKKRCQG